LPAIETAAAMDPTALSVLPAERRANHFLDVGRAYSLSGQREEAVSALLEADELAPKGVRCRPLARDLIIDLWRRSRATTNSINKWAAGISDTLALGVLVEAIGKGLRVVAMPFTNRAQAAHPVFEQNIGRLRPCRPGASDQRSSG
jgi:hypothetical protein